MTARATKAAIIICAGLLALSLLLTGITATAAQANTLTPDPWPQFGQGQGNRGLAVAPGPDSPALRWKDDSKRTINSPVIGEGGVIYSGDGVRLIAMDSAGGTLWDFNTRGGITSPTLDRSGRIVFGSSDHHLYCIDSHGNLLWTFTAEDFITSSPAIADDGTIYFGSYDHKLYAVGSNGEQKWEYETGMPVVSSPAIGGDSSIYFGSGDHNLYNLNPDGTLKWVFAAAGKVNSSPVVDGQGTVYFGDERGNLYAVGNDGQKRWEFQAGDAIRCAPAIGPDGTVYFTAENAKLFAVSPTGSKKWELKLDARPSGASPAVDTKGTVFAGTASGGSLYAVNPAGTIKWQLAGSPEKYHVSVPAIAADGTIYAGWSLRGMPGGLVAIGGNDTFGYEQYLAEGTTRDGFQEWLHLKNTSSAPAKARVTYMLSGGRNIEREYELQSRERLSLDVNSEVGPGMDVAVKVTSTALLVVERSMYFQWDGYNGGHITAGLSEPRKSYYFAEGCTRTGFREFLSLLNPGTEEAHVNVTYMLASGENVLQGLALAPMSRTTLDVNQAVGPGQDIAVRLESDQPVVAERPMYFDYHGKWLGGHTAIGAEAPGKKWYFAEGTTRAGFEEWISINNPGDLPAEVSINYLLSNGPNKVQRITLPPRSRRTVDVRAFLGPGQDTAVELESSQPVVAERPMYFSNKGAIGGHDVLGTASPSRRYFLAEGTTRNGFNTWICLLNPDQERARVIVTYEINGARDYTKVVEMDGRSRVTLDPASEIGPDQDFSIRVESDRSLVVERPMYFNTDGVSGGHDTIGMGL